MSGMTGIIPKVICRACSLGDRRCTESGYLRKAAVSGVGTSGDASGLFIEWCKCPDGIMRSQTVIVAANAEQELKETPAKMLARS
jgi:hypothetical protein